MKSLNYRQITTEIGRKQLDFCVDSWKEYKIGELFAFSKGKRLTKAEMVPGNTNFLIADWPWIRRLNRHWLFLIAVRDSQFYFFLEKTSPY